MLLLAAFVVGCSGTTPVDIDAGRIACPADPPADRATCSDPGLLCVYERCASGGLVRARCEPGDAGDASWTVASEPCDSACSGRTCSAGNLCVANVAGAFLIDCRPHACGSGPLTCECVCGEGVSCEAYGSARDGALFACYVGCGADVCP